MPSGPDPMSQLGKEIKRAREKMKIDQSELARRSGVHQSTISNIERGKTGQPKADNLESLAKVLGLKSRRLKMLAGILTEDEFGESQSTSPAASHDLDPEIQQAIDEFYEEFMKLSAEDQRRSLKAALWMPQLSEENQELVITMIFKLAGQETVS